MFGILFGDDHGLNLRVTAVSEVGGELVAEEIGIGLAVGLLITGMAGWLLKIARRRQWLTEIWIQIVIGGHIVPAQIDPQSTIGVNGIAANGVSD